MTKERAKITVRLVFISYYAEKEWLRILRIVAIRKTKDFFHKILQNKLNFECNEKISSAALGPSAALKCTATV